jgi:hypothetical protein
VKGRTQIHWKEDFEADTGIKLPNHSRGVGEEDISPSLKNFTVHFVKFGDL